MRCLYCNCIVTVLHVGKSMIEYEDDSALRACAKDQLPRSCLSHILTVDRMDPTRLLILGNTRESSTSNSKSVRTNPVQ